MKHAGGVWSQHATAVVIIAVVATVAWVGQIRRCWRKQTKFDALQHKDELSFLVWTAENLKTKEEV